MWERIIVSAPVIAGALLLFGAFCASLVAFEKKEYRRRTVQSRSSFSYKKNLPLRNVTSPARSYPSPSYSFCAEGFCEKASSRTAV